MDARDEDASRPADSRSRQLNARRARFAAAGSLIAVVILIAVIVFATHGGSGSHGGTSSPKSATQAGSALKRAPTPGTTNVPILAYQVINVAPSQSSVSHDSYVPTSEFSAQINALKAHGWHAVTLNQLQAYWTRGVRLGPGKPIVLSFDGGYASHYTNALAVLKRVGWVGVENLSVTRLPPSEGGMDDSQVGALIAAGWELDAEGDTKQDPTTLDSAQLMNQLKAQRQALRSRYNAPANWFCYPSGRYNATVIAAARAAGFVGATTLTPGWASPQGDRFRLPRVQVVGGTSPSELLSQVASAQQDTSAPPASAGA
jgi:peptidoglycan/xylan/chitin deacetylase (PgdA/CDA1 family)